MWRFLDIVFPPRGSEVLVRACTESSLAALMQPLSVPATHPACVSLLPFSDERVRALMHEAKYHGNSRAFALLASVLRAHLEASVPEYEHAVFIPIPLGKERLKERGYNQVAEVLKRAVGKSAVSGILTRARETASQVSLPRYERAENMRGAFTATRPLDPSTLHIVCDDVLTTGATLQAALDALTEAGARRILPLAFAH
jgi:predicted amidophosphoribosyltransferase